MLSKRSEYEGGGTYIHALQRTIVLQQGQVLCHPGELYHKGVDITKGSRRLVVCFMDGYNPGITDTLPNNDEIHEFEKNILMM
jgi:hypothetical protein